MIIIVNREYVEGYQKQGRNVSICVKCHQIISPWITISGNKCDDCNETYKRTRVRRFIQKYKLLE